MGRFCLISFCNLYMLPYAKTYIDAICNSGNSCTLLFWDRDAVNGNNDYYPECEKICYQMKLTPKTSRFKKMIGYLKSSSFFKKVLNKENFSGLIFLQTHVAIFCDRTLKKKYAKKYIVDIRDYMLEGYSYFYNIEKRVLTNSFANIISSPAYTKFLPKGDYVLAHNLKLFDKKTIESIRNRKKSRETINISFIGTIRFIQMDKKVLSLFANDLRFNINYFGAGSDVLETWAKHNNIQNASFSGPFKPEDTSVLYQKTDIINNLYGSNSPYLDYALSNKLYHSIQFNMPILVCPNTYMAAITEKYGIGFVFDFDDPFIKEKLVEWYKNLDFNLTKKQCDILLKRVIEENNSFIATIERFLNSDFNKQ